FHASATRTNEKIYLTVITVSTAIASTNESYQSDEEQRKQAFIAEFSKAAAAGCAWDLGCNTGLYSEILLKNGTHTVVGFDFDLYALEAAVDRATSKNLQLL